MKTTIKFGEGTQWEATAKWVQGPIGAYGLRLEFKNPALNPKTEFVQNWSVPIMREKMEDPAFEFWSSCVEVFQSLRGVQKPKWFLVEPQFMPNEKTIRWIKENRLFYAGLWVELRNGCLIEAKKSRIVNPLAECILWLPKESR